MQAQSESIQRRNQIMRAPIVDHQLVESHQIQPVQPAQVSEPAQAVQAEPVAQEAEEPVEEEVKQAATNTVLNPYTGRNIKIGGKAHQDMLRKLALERISTQAQQQHRINQFYQGGKTIIDRFIDNGQLELLRRDIREYTSDETTQQSILDYINQLEQLNVIPSAFNYEHSKEDYLTKLPETEQVQFDASLLYECYQNQLSIINISTKDQFDEYFSCCICYKAFDAKARIGNKSCSVCSFNSCQQCYLKLQNNKQCPLKCKLNTDSFVELPKHLFDHFQQLQFKCKKCDNMFKTADFQQHLSADGGSSCSEVSLYDCPYSGCDAKDIDRKLVNTHVQSCPDYKIKCNNCSQMIKQQHIQVHSCMAAAIQTRKVLADPFRAWLNDERAESFIITQASGSLSPATLTAMIAPTQAYVNTIKQSDRNTRDTITMQYALHNIIVRLLSITNYKPIFASFTVPEQQVIVTAPSALISNINKTAQFQFTTGQSITVYFYVL